MSPGGLLAREVAVGRGQALSLDRCRFPVMGLIGKMAWMAPRSIFEPVSGGSIKADSIQVFEEARWN